MKTPERGTKKTNPTKKEENKMPGKHYLIDVDMYQQQEPIFSFLTSAQTEIKSEEEDQSFFFEALELRDDLQEED